MMILENKFDIGQIVYITTDADQLPRLIIQLKITPSGIIYVCQHGTSGSEHYDIELSSDKNLVSAI